MADLVSTLTTMFTTAVGRPLTATDSFFAAGGDSLGAAEVLARIEDELGVELVYRDFLEAPTPAKLGVTIILARAQQRGGDLAAEIAALSAEDATILIAELETRGTL